jgi:hypothetical protein
MTLFLTISVVQTRLMFVVHALFLSRYFGASMHFGKRQWKATCEPGVLCDAMLGRHRGRSGRECLVSFPQNVRAIPSEFTDSKRD